MNLNRLFKSGLLLDPLPMGGGGVALDTAVADLNSQSPASAASVPSNDPANGDVVISPASPAPATNAPVDGGEEPFSFDSFKKAALAPENNTPAPAPAPAATSAPAPAPRVATPAPAPAAIPTVQIDFGKPTAQPATASAPPNIINGRDYAGLAPEEVEMFKKMGNEAFAKLKPVYLEHQQLKQQATQWATERQQLQQQAQANPNVVPQSYYEHPEAYTLTPAHKMLVQENQFAQLESNHWQKQLEAFRSGQKPKDLLFNPQTQTYHYGQELESNAATEAAILTKMQQSQMWQNEINQKYQQFVGGYKNQHQQFVKSIKQAEDTYFPYFAEGKDHPYKDLIKQVQEIFPEGIRKHNPLVPLVAKSYAAVIELQRQITELKGKPAQSIQQDIVAAGPTTSVMNSGVHAQPQTLDDDPNLFDKFVALKNR